MELLSTGECTRPSACVHGTSGLIESSQGYCWEFRGTIILAGSGCCRMSRAGRSCWLSGRCGCLSRRCGDLRCGFRFNFFGLTFEIGFGFGFGFTVHVIEYVCDALNGLDVKKYMYIDEQDARERVAIYYTFVERAEH